MKLTYLILISIIYFVFPGKRRFPAIFFSQMTPLTKNTPTTCILIIASLAIREEEFPPIGHTGLTNKLESMLGIHLGGYYRVSVYHQAGEGKVHHDSFRVPNQINEVKMFTKRLASIIIYVSIS